MDGIMTLAEMEQRFESEWILVVDPELDESGEVVQGTVAFHSKDRAEIDRKDIELRPRSAAYVYTGATPDNVAFAL